MHRRSSLPLRSLPRPTLAISGVPRELYHRVFNLRLLQSIVKSSAILSKWVSRVWIFDQDHSHPVMRGRINFRMTYRCRDLRVQQLNNPTTHRRKVDADGQQGQPAMTLNIAPAKAKSLDNRIVALLHV